MSALNGDHGGLALLAVQGGENVQKGVRRVFGTTWSAIDRIVRAEEGGNMENTPIGSIPDDNVIFPFPLQVGKPSFLDITARSAKLVGPNVEDGMRVEWLARVDRSGQDVVIGLEKV